MSPISRLVTKEYRQISHHDTTARPRMPGGRSQRIVTVDCAIPPVNGLEQPAVTPRSYAHAEFNKRCI